MELRSATRSFVKDSPVATATHLLTEKEALARPEPEAVVVRFAGDSGDGMQLTGGQFTLSTALAGNDLATFPDFPAEIRAPQGTTFGVSAFQINFGSCSIETAGDQPDVLIAMNPAALKVNADQLRDGGLIIADEGEFTPRNLTKAGYESNPLEDGSLARWQLVHFNISQLTLDAVKPFGLGNKEALRCKNMWTLGLALWMFDRDREPIVQWLRTKFAKAPDLVLGLEGDDAIFLEAGEMVQQRAGGRDRIGAEEHLQPGELAAGDEAERQRLGAGDGSI